MAVTNPTDGKLTAYAGNTFNYKFTFVKDGTDDPIDLAADYTEIIFKVFKRGKIDSPDIEYTVGDGHSILNTNELVGEIPADSDSETDTQDLFGPVYYFELRLKTNDGEDDAYWVGRFIVNNYASGGGEQSADVEVTVDQVTHEISISEATNSAAAAANHEAAAESAKDAAETAESGAVSAKNDAETAETNAANSASAASTSETNAANSATTASNEADRAESEADDAEQSALNAEAEAEQQVIDAHGYYAKELSNIKQRLRDLENA